MGVILRFGQVFLRHLSAYQALVLLRLLSLRQLDLVGLQRGVLVRYVLGWPVFRTLAHLLNYVTRVSDVMLLFTNCIILSDHILA